MSTLFGEKVRLADGIFPFSHGDVTLLPSEDRCFELHGALAQSLLPLLNGEYTAAGLVGRLRDRFSPPQVLGMLGMLENEGLLVAGAEPDGLLVPESVNERMSVSVHAKGEAAELLNQALADHAINLLPSDRKAALRIRLVDDYYGLDEKGPADASQCWMPIKMAGPVVWFGPIFRPDQSACPSCLMHRIRLTQEAYILAKLDALPRIPSSAASAAVQFCALQIARWLQNPAADDHPLNDGLVRIGDKGSGFELHRVVRRPQCPECGSACTMEPSPILVGDGADHKHDLLGKAPDEALLERFGHHVDRITGLVSALEPVSEHPLNVFRARYVRPIAASTEKRAVENRRLVAAGKGTTSKAAEAGALAEALERYSSTWDGSEALTIASAKGLGDSCILPNDCMLFSDNQLKKGGTGEGLKQLVPRQLDPDAPIGWLKAWSLSRSEWRFVAAGWALMGYGGHGRDYSVGDSNGNAAGWSINDAIMRGAGELIERDAVALWWYNCVGRPGVNLDRIKPNYIAELQQHLFDTGREFWVLDLTSDIGFPTFAAVSQRIDGGPVHPIIAFGAHIDPETAVLRAITEMNQMLPHALAKAPREDRPAPKDGSGDSMTLETLENHQYLMPDPSLPETHIEAISPPVDQNLAHQIASMERKFSAAGMEMLVLDHSRPDVGLPVVRVIVPGLRHFWRRLAPGRLYDVPVQMGWLEKAKTEADINPLELAI